MLVKGDAKRSDFKFNILRESISNLEFFIHNIFLIMLALFLLGFNIVHAYYGLASYIGSNRSDIYFLLPFTISMILIPILTLLYFGSFLRTRGDRLRDNGSNFIIVLGQMLMPIFIFMVLLTHVLSSWASFESFFHMIFNNTIIEIKDRYHETEINTRELLNLRKNGIKSEIFLIDLKIEGNRQRIELARGQYLGLDQRQTHKQKLIDEINAAHLENKNLEELQNKCFNDLENLNMELARLSALRVANNDKLKGISVLTGMSDVVRRDGFYQIFFVYLLLFLSVCLNISLSMLFFRISGAYGQFHRQEFGRDKKNRRIDLTEIPERFCDLLEFVIKNLGKDNRTVKSIEALSKEANISYYTIREDLKKLIYIGFILKEKQRFVVNVDFVRELSKEILNNAFDNAEVMQYRRDLRQKYPAICTFGSTISD
ncbi:hypothetical protein CR532_04565 (plasmid) [Candidatus Borreliella tachyglossi]|uniref:Uncharacterized protein n=1 Tax=Candidatus Borreliella tachyglossi TaxID=1964448 RepID=A0A2S1LYA2_9SPIR|nr:replication/maintenance protein RepL [Candidatus Borreliella tachyglossi]AWG43273.1 hypothetical protein CR532_04565 [Candidatus Borreliella tachyglossi]